MARAGPLSMNWLGMKIMYNGNGKVSGIDLRFGRNVQHPS
jgi:hypothetical protein